MSEATYDAFISYRRSDGGAVARWLRRQLEGFRVPSALRGSHGGRLKVYLDTAYERGSSDFYELNIKPALLGSRWLLVVATPAAINRGAGGDDWIRREVADFSQGPHGRNVVVVRGAGEFADPLPADLKERFPNIEIVDLRGAGRFVFLNPIRAARLSAEKLKLVAPLLQIPADAMPLLRREEEIRQQGRSGAVMGAAAGILLAVGYGAISETKTRFDAIRALESSMFATGRMVQSVAQRLDRSGDAGLRRNLLNEGCDLIDKLRIESGRDARISDLVRCRIERGLEHEQQDEAGIAKAKFQEAVDLATARHSRQAPIEAARSIVVARQALADHLLRTKDFNAADAELRRFHADAKRLGAIHDQRLEFVEAEAEALGRLGDVFVAQGNRAEAGNRYDEAAEAVERVVKASALGPERSKLAWLMRLYRLAGEQREELADLDGAMARFTRAVEARQLIDGSRLVPAINVEAAHSYALMFSVRRRQGNAAAAATARSEALVAADQIVTAKSASNNQRQFANRIRAWIDRQPRSGQDN